MMDMDFKDGEFERDTTTVVVDEFDKSGFSRRDEADMAEVGKKQQFNVSPRRSIECCQNID